MSVKNRYVIVVTTLITAVVSGFFQCYTAKADVGCGISTAASCEFITVQEPVTDGDQANQPVMKNVIYRIDYIDSVEVLRTPIMDQKQSSEKQSWGAKVPVNMVSERLEKLREKYPDHYYWNHEITQENKGKTVNGTWIETWCDVVSSKPCSHSFDTIGQYGCNAFDHKTACWGFAHKVFYDVFGIRAYSTERLYDVENISVGDHVRFGYTHSAIVLSRNGDKITLLECNYNAVNCQIQWDRTETIQNVIWYQHADKWDQINQTP